MSRLADVLPDRRNPMRPVLIILVLGFGAMLIGFPVGMQMLGLGTGSMIVMAVLVLAVAVLCISFTLMLSRAYARDREEVLAGDVLASWELTPEDHRSFVGAERGRMWRKAAAYGFGGLALGLVLGFTMDWLIGGIMIGAFLLATVVILWTGGPPRGTSADERAVRIGPRGVDLLGRYLPFDAPGTRLLSVRLSEGDVGELRFGVRSGRQLDEFRVPVPRERLPEAEALVERFQREIEARG